MNKANKMILLPPPIKKELAATFKVERHVLNDYLSYRVNSRRARMLRAAALQRGGLIYTGAHAPKGYCPDVETSFDHAAGIMRQTFGERVELIVKRENNEAIIVIDNSPVATFSGMTLSAWGDVLYSLQRVYNNLNQ